MRLTIRFTVIPTGIDSAVSRSVSNSIFKAFRVLCAVLAFCFAATSCARAVTSTTASLTLTSGGSAVSSLALGKVVTLTATVKAASTTLTQGQVLFCDATAAHCTDIHVLGTAQITSSGSAVLKLAPGFGSHSYKAVFAGTNNYASSASSAETLNVTGLRASSVTLTSNASNESYNLTASVAGIGTAQLTQGGSVAISDVTNGGYLLGTAKLGAVSSGFQLAPGTSPSASGILVAVGDFNGDGVPDLVTFDSKGGMTVSLGIGDGTFKNLPSVQSFSLTYIFSIEVADFNADGRLDLAVVGNANNVVVLLGNGDGTFGTPNFVDTGMEPTGMIVGDWNGDGLPDLAVTAAQSNEVNILLGHGDGTFSAAANVPVEGPAALVSGDFNGDGKADLIVARDSDFTVNIYLGQGDGTFAAGSTIPGLSAFDLTGLVIGDFNGDGKADLAAGNFAYQISIFLGNGDGTFTQGPPSMVSEPGNLIVADFNGDGIADIATSDDNNGEVEPIVLIGNGDGTFNLVSSNFDESESSLASGDFNGDGYADLVYVQEIQAAYGDAPPAILFGQQVSTASGALNNVEIVGTGTHTIQAVYAGDSNYAAAPNTTINLAAAMVSPILTLSTSPASSTYGGQVALTATLSPAVVQNQSTDGESISFYTGQTLLGSATLRSGAANLSLTSLAGGVDNLSATYPGDSNFSGTTSNTLYLSVTKATPGLNWATPQPIAYGTALSATQLNATASVPGIFLYAPPAGTVLSVGTQTLSVTFTPTDNVDYASVTATVYLDVVTSGLRFIPITPCRAADTRGPVGEFGAPELAAGTSREFDLPESNCGIPSTAVAYSLNVTVVPNEILQYLTLWPSGTPQPYVSTLNSYDGRVKANAAITPAGLNGGVNVFVSDASNVILDVDGYFVPAGTSSALAFYPLSPCRVADTRNPTGALGGPFVAGQTSRSFPVQSSACGIPATAQAYSLNVTTVPLKALDYLTTWPTGQPQPYVSTLNAPTGAVTANAAIVPAGTGGAVSFFVSDDANVILDVNGYFAPSTTGGLSLYSVTPCRVIDTRDAEGAFDGVFQVPFETSGCALPAVAEAYVVNATVAPPGPLVYLTLWPDGQSQPYVSTLNADDGAVTSNMAIVPTTNGTIDVFSSDPTQLIMDISGFFAP